MPPRPATRQKESRPVSAIYLGSPANAQASSSQHSSQTPHSSSPSFHLANGGATDLPDLPEPPSPGSSIDSRGSGLPSPPATNSTGSGSTGDPGSIALRQRPLSLASDSSASTGSSHRTLSERTPVLMSATPASVRSTSRQAYFRDDERLSNANDDDDHDDHDPDGDDTARLDRRHHVKSSSENVLALQRVKNLTQRNRMAIDKLARLGSPAPSNPGSRSTSSPVPSQNSSTASSKLRQVRTVALPSSRDHGASGSETERESASAQTYSSHSHSSSSHASSSKRPITPPQGNANVAFVGTTSPYNRLRHISAPDSPQKARLLNTASGSSSSSNSPSHRRRQRASMASMSSIQAYDEEEDAVGSESRFSTATGTGRDRVRERDTIRDITESALAAVASSRRSPVGTRRRSALPREFREGIGETDSVASDAHTRRSDHSPDRRRFSSIDPVTPYRGVGRSATLRDVTRSGGPPSSRWQSDGSPTGPTPESKRERRATLRGGSAESALWSPGGRTLLGEGLRAAGLTVRRDEVRTLGPSSATGDVFRDRERRVDLSPQDAEDKGARRAFTPARELAKRAATSMADYRSLDRRDDDDDAEPDRRVSPKNPRNALGTAITTTTTRDRAMSLSRRPRDLSLTRAERDQLELDRASQPPPTAATVVPRHLTERHSTASPFGSKRMSQTPLPGSSASTAEHVRLLIESLASFEGNVAKLPPSALPNLGKIPSASELLNQAQNVVYATERINSILRQGTNRALEEQINAEVEGDEASGSQEMLEVWRRVGGEYREGLRASDELVRALTGFLMDVGSTMRKLAPSTVGSEYGSPATHLRSISLDDEGIRQQQRAAAGSDQLSGRRSVEPASRLSWEPLLREREREREETMRKLAGTTGRDTSLSMARASPALGTMRERDRSVYETPSPMTTASKALPPLSANGATTNGLSRRLFTPSQQRDRQYGSGEAINPPPPRPGSSLRPSDSQRTLQPLEVDPSPTPASRVRDRTKTLHPTPAPRPLPTLPSEQARRTPISRSNGASNGTDPDGALSSASEDRNHGNDQNSIRARVHERPKPSVASIVTVRGSQAPSFPGLTTPSTATTGVTAHVVSSSPEQSPMLVRTTSTKSARSVVTFSRPSASSASAALSAQQHSSRDGDRRRTPGQPSTDTSSSDQSSLHSPTQVKLDVQQQPKKLAAIALAKVRSAGGTPSPSPSGSDLEGGKKRASTSALGLGASPRLGRASLDGGALTASPSGGSGTGKAAAPFAKESTAHAADRHAASTVLPRVKERRRTVTDIWPRE